MTRAGARLGLLLAALPAVAGANGTHLPDVLDVRLRPGDTESAWIESNFGLLDSGDGSAFTWICHEAITEVPGVTPLYARGGDGTVLATVRLPGFGVDPDETVYRSADGCTWSPVTGLTGIAAATVAFDPADPSHALAAAANGGGKNNALWVSNDGGQTWSKTALEVPSFVYGVAFAQADPQVVWVTSADPQAPQAAVHRSADGGLTWTSHPWTQFPPSLALGSLAVLATSTTSADVAWLRTYGVPNRLWRTTNGGAAFELVLGAAGIQDAEALPDGRVWVATATSGLFLSIDGGRSFERAAAAPHARGFAADARGLFIASDPYQDGFALMLASGGDPTASATGRFRLADLAGPKECPAGSTVKTICDPLWPALQVRLGLVPGRIPFPVAKLATGEPKDAAGGGCACSTARPAALPAWILGLLAAAVLAGRRGRRR